nr:N-acetylmuramoyl-L-alanine amidase [Tissierella sp.]
MLRKMRRLFSMILLTSIILIGFKVLPFIAKKVISSENPIALGKTIVIDAGHGGHDGGTIGVNGSYEKDINLEISQKIIKKLQAKGYEVISTRDNDEYIDNIERARLANRSSSDVFLSIHCNALENNDYISGAQVLYYPDKNKGNQDLNNKNMAETMMNSIVSATGVIDKGIIEREDLIVLNQTNMPAMVVECGFLSNPNEEKLLLNSRYQNKLVDSIIQGLEDYLR